MMLRILNRSLLIICFALILSLLGSMPSFAIRIGNPIPGSSLEFECKGSLQALSMKYWQRDEQGYWVVMREKNLHTLHMDSYMQKKSYWQLYSPFAFYSLELEAGNTIEFKEEQNSFPENADFSPGSTYTALLSPKDVEKLAFLGSSNLNIEIETQVSSEQEFSSPTLGKRKVYVIREKLTGPANQAIQSSIRYDSIKRSIIHIKWTKTDFSGTKEDSSECNLKTTGT